MKSETKKKVLFLIPSLVYRGAERMLVNLVNQFDQTRFSIHVVSLSHDNPMADQIRPEAAAFTALPRRWRYDMGPAWGLNMIILEEQIDTILAFDIFSFFYAWISLWGVRSRPKIFISIHNTKYKSFRHWLQNFIYARLLSEQEVFLSVCGAQVDYWAKTYRIPRGSFITIHNGVDTAFFSPSTTFEQKRQLRSLYGIPEEAYVILQVASFAPEKRHEDAFLALKHLLGKVKAPIAFMCVGAGAETRRHFLKKFAQQTGVGEQLVFCGIQNDVRPFYEMADLFTLTSSTETFSMAALEAMSMGVPCVLTDVGGASEMILNAVNGYLVPAGDPEQIAEGWLAVYRNQLASDRQQIRNRIIERFSLTQCARKYENLLIDSSPASVLIGEKHVENQSL